MTRVRKATMPAAVVAVMALLAAVLLLAVSVARSATTPTPLEAAKTAKVDADATLAAAQKADQSAAATVAAIEASAPPKEEPPKEPPPGETVSFTPTAIPLTAAEIPNSGRGLYDWMGEHSMTPAGWPIVDYYQRDSISWPRDLEPSKGVYPFLTQPGVIDQGIASAAAKGGKLRLRVMAWMAGGTGRFPSYVPTITACGSTFPDWNSAGWLEAWDNLWRALGQKYGQDSRIGLLDVGGYGAWGEWHMNGCTTANTHITTANGVRMAGAVVRAFPKAHVVLGTSAAVKDESPLQPPLLLAIVKTYPTVGYHFDNYGATPPGNGNNLSYLKPGGLAANSEAWDRWKQAPVIAENWNTTGWTIANAKQSLEEFHVAEIGSGNNPGAPYKQNVGEWETILKRSGFRYQLDKVTVPSTITRAVAFTAASAWENVNVAPTYDSWQVSYELIGSSGVAWSASSALDLRTVLPTNGTPVARSDSLTIPSSVPAGSYTLAVTVTDPNHYLAPMRLADQGRASDGSYPLGVVNVG